VARKELITQLIATVKLDLEIITQEDVETDMREEGFWRFAGKAAYAKIKKVREDFDWATGQKKGKAMIDLDDEESDTFEQFPATPVHTQYPEIARTPFSVASSKSMNATGSKKSEEYYIAPKALDVPRLEGFKLDQENPSMKTVHRHVLQTSAGPTGSSYRVV
jgi:hypothetical protein